MAVTWIMKRSQTKLKRTSGLAAVPRVLALTCGVLGAGGSAHAASILLPPDLVPGQTFQVAFVTTGTIDANSSDINVYNNFVADAAAAAGLDVIDGQAVNWHAIMSTSTIDARDNAPQTAPVYDLQTHLITPLPGGLWTTSRKFLKHPINVSESGNALIMGYVWTASSTTGTYSEGPLVGRDLQLVGLGELVSIFPNWLHAAYLTPDNQYHLYALSSPITVPSPVPEPPSIRLSLLGALDVGANAWPGVGSHAPARDARPSARRCRPQAGRFEPLRS